MAGKSSRTQFQRQPKHRQNSRITPQSTLCLSSYKKSPGFGSGAFLVRRVRLLFLLWHAALLLGLQGADAIARLVE